MNQISRSEHVAWCKKRAIEYIELGDLNQALASMSSDLQKHPETAGDKNILLIGMSLLLSGNLDTPAKMREFIEGFN